MAIVAECPRCGKRLKADEKLAGKKAKCSQCAHVFVIGGAGPAQQEPHRQPQAATLAAPAPPEPPPARNLPSHDLPIPNDLPRENTPDITLNIDRAPAKPPEPASIDERPVRKSKLPLVAA